MNTLELVVAMPAPVRPRGVTPRFPNITHVSLFENWK